MLASPELVKAEGGGINFSTTLDFTSFETNFGLLSGLNFGYNINSSIYFGFALSSNTLYKHNINAYDPNIDFNPTFEFNYYGLSAEYFINPKSQVHFSIIATGGISNTFLSSPYNKDLDSNLYYPDYTKGTTNLIFVPGFRVNLNLKKFYRLSLGVSYRFLPNFELKDNNLLDLSKEKPYIMNESYVNGLSISFTAKFGSF